MKYSSDYEEGWVVIPIDDRREMFWSFDGNEILYAENENDLRELSGEYYANTLYQQRFLSKWVYEKQDFTMICVDTHCDGNKFLAIFSNKKRYALDSKKENKGH